MAISKRRKSKVIPNKLNKLLEVPKEVYSNIPKLTIIGFEQMLIENYRISTEIGILNINGFKLDLEEMTTDDLLINGKIDSIDFEPITDDEES